MIHDKKELLNKLQILTKNGNESDIKMLLESMGVISFKFYHFSWFFILVQIWICWKIKTASFGSSF